jgi:spermidine synthase
MSLIGSQRSSTTIAITLLSVLILFLEMLLIRWIGTEVRVFAYLQNGVLVAAFLGLGLGARSARAPVRLLPGICALAAIGCVIRDPFGWGIGEALTQGLVAFEDSVIWARSVQSLAAARQLRVSAVGFSLFATLGLLYTVAVSFRPLGQKLGRLMDQHPRPIVAYTGNVVGSIVGIWLFNTATLIGTPPSVWLALAGIGLACLAPWTDGRKMARVAAAALALALPLAGLSSSHHREVWSPYQKLTLMPAGHVSAVTRQAVVCGEQINVNNSGYQILADVDPERMRASPEAYPPREIGDSHYVLPYRLVGPRQRVLVVGAGSGNDVAAALRAGARQVHAVEIDPQIISLGRERHPNRPYASSRVSVTIDDARAFFRRESGPFDLVWFGLLDSHTTPSAYTNVRLDHFVYTRESFVDMKHLLAPGGVVILFFEAQAPWIADRLVGLLRSTFGSVPLAMWVRSSSPCLGWGGLMLIAGTAPVLDTVRARALASPEISKHLIPSRVWPLVTEANTDDWPYLYLEKPTIPMYHLLVGLCCLGLGLALRGRLFSPGEPVNGTMVLLGAGFMLLEVSGVSRAALLFGTTWTVNAYVVGAMLSMALLANLVASRFRFSPSGWPFLGLMVALFALTLVPPGWLAVLPSMLRIIIGGAFLSLPVFFSGLIFVRLWADTARKDLAFGSNLIGSLVGGVASLLSMVIGFRALLLLGIAVYLGALLAMRRASPQRS